MGLSRIISVKLVRSTYTVQITSPSLSHPGTKFTAVFYDGPNAQQVCSIYVAGLGDRLNLENSRHTKMIYIDTLHYGDYYQTNDIHAIYLLSSHINFAKLFGITHWGLPALIFHSGKCSLIIIEKSTMNVKSIH